MTSGAARNRTEHEKTVSDNHVDLATGELFLAQTDVELPGVLSLVLRRTHCSNYRFGRWFGPSWSATLDVRLVVEREGVTFLSEDGVMLAFPHPGDGVAVQPITGVQRWTLTHTEVGAYQLWDQRRELIWHFAPEPGLGGEESQLGNYAVSAITDRFRNRVRFHYDRRGVPVEVSHSGGYRVLIDTESGRVTRLSVHDRGSVVPMREFAYEAGELVTETNAVGASTQYTYDEHRMTAWTDSNSNQMVNTYDDSGRVVFQRGIFGVLDCDFIYAEFPDNTGSLTTVIDSLEAVTRYGFDHDLQLRDLVDPGGGHTHRDYNVDRRPLKVIGPDGALTHYRYTADGDIAQIRRPDEHALSFEYAFRGRPTVCTDVDGSVRHQEWDGSGNLIAVTDPAGARTEYRYHPNGAVAEVIGEGGVRTMIEVDGAGLSTRITHPAGAVTSVDRDGFGRPVLSIDPLGAQIHYEWSVAGKLLSRTDSDGHTESWSYDGEGSLLTHTDRAGGLTSFTYGPFALLASRTDPDGSTTDFRYDSQRRLVGVINPLGQRWSYEYDLAGRLIAETDYSGVVTRFTYDRNGRVATTIADTGVTVHHSYDLLGRPIETIADTGEFVRYTYDPAGRVRTATSGTGDEIGHTLAFGYTVTGECAAQQLDDEPAMRYEYDSQGRPTRRTSPSGAVTSWKYNSAGHIRSMDTDDHCVDFSYDPLGRLTGWRVGEIDCSRAHTEYGCVSEQQVIAFPAVSLSLDLGSGDRPDPMSIRRDEYSYRPDGYVTAHRSDGTGAEPVERQYTLDPVGRVTAVSRNGIPSTAYQYDPLSNIVAATVPHATAGDTGLVFDEHGSREYRGNLLIRAGHTRYHYDRSARLIRKERTHRSRETEAWHHRYNAFGQLTDVWTPTRQWWHYTYDGLGRRVTKLLLRTDGTVVESADFTWDGIRLIEQETEHSITRWNYEPHTFVPVTQTTDRAGVVDREFLAVLTDPTGSRTDLIEADTGQIAGSAESDLWGQIVWHAGNSTPLRFPGGFHDPETGLHYDDQRYYDPGTGRYITPDPLGRDSSPNPLVYQNIPRLPTIVTASDVYAFLGLCGMPDQRPVQLGCRKDSASARNSAPGLGSCPPAVALPELTSTKWIVWGGGQIRPV
ncbi:hypothetical protein KO481_15215 [Nocardia sp. NEAU-G5]|uniref:Type IV secretion protein Rhs n=1 Tax=Nocardia albiluteola TaxID=2842303 RepID=A0ABS6AXU1_9NOCA|nr:DUF6531 domain-containing protein [Nocardia albiluteola]MBU3062868.1 hypothetical protein [Nocardia albiluteola]